MESIFYLALFLIVPAAAIVWFVISLVLLVRTPKNDTKRRPRKVMAVISGAVTALIVGAAVFAAIAFVFMFLSAMAHM